MKTLCVFPAAGRWVSPLLALLAVLAGALPARATSALQLEVEAVAKNLKQFLDGQNSDSCYVGQFSGPPEASAGPVITKILTEELKKSGITVRLRADMIVEGDYCAVIDRETKQLAAKIKFQVVNRQREVFFKAERGVFGDETLPTMFGLTVHLPPSAERKERDQYMQEAMDKPQAPKITNSRVNAKGPYAVEVLVYAGDKLLPRTAEVHDGLAFVPITRGEKYGVRLINDSPYEAAVNLTIDGINMFAFSNVKNAAGQPRYKVIVVPAKGNTVIEGWHRDNKISERFVITEYSKTAAFELKSTANIGTITACFSAAWPKNGPRPPDEPSNPDPHSRSADGTGRGEQFRRDFQEVERLIGVVRDTISVRYNR